MIILMSKTCSLTSTPPAAVLPTTAAAKDAAVARFPSFWLLRRCFSL
jgi:hypothetical protein